jgi:hypothetical protein
MIYYEKYSMYEIKSEEYDDCAVVRFFKEEAKKPVGMRATSCLLCCSCKKCEKVSL